MLGNVLDLSAQAKGAQLEEQRFDRSNRTIFRKPHSKETAVQSTERDKKLFQSGKFS